MERSSRHTTPRTTPERGGGKATIAERAPERAAASPMHETVHRWLARFPADAPVVVVPVTDTYDDAVECIERLLAARPKDAPLLVIDEATSDTRIGETLERLSRDDAFLYVRQPAGHGPTHGINASIAASAPRDVVLVASHVVVPPGWLERLQTAAYYRTTIATATSLTNDGTLLSVPYRNHPIRHIPKGMTIEQADDRIRRSSLRLYPMIPGPVGHCTYYKRSALDVVGAFDEGFALPSAAAIDFAQRAIATGFSHVVADDLFIYTGEARAIASEEMRARIDDAMREIDTRYPWYHGWVGMAARSTRDALALALERARAALIGYRVAIDARSVSETTAGTQVVTLELIRALATRPDRCDHLAVIIGDEVPRKALQGVDQLVDEVVRAGDLLRADQPVFDLIHRPFQVYSIDDLSFLHKVASRFIVTHLDCIAFANPSYAATLESWSQTRHAMQLSFAYADGVLFLSEDAAQDAAHQGLVMPEERACVAYTGVDHHLLSLTVQPPADREWLEDGPFILVVGTNFKHKNRIAAMRLLKTLMRRDAWPGRLVFAGPDTARGGSSGAEARERLSDPELQSRVRYLGAVSEHEKRWLYEHAALVLYPSIYEGFGMVAFEAAAAGTPALTPRATALAEVLGDQVSYLDTLDPETGAETVWRMMTDPEAGRRQVEAINARAALFTWNAVAAAVGDFYQRVLAMPPRAQIVRVGEEIQRGYRNIQDERQRMEHEIHAFRQQYHAIQQESQDVQGECQRLSALVDDVQREYHTLADRAAALSDQLDATRRERQEMSNQTAELGDRLGRAERERGELSHRSAELKHQLGHAQREQQALADWSAQLDQQLAETRRAYQELSDWSAELSRRLTGNRHTLVRRILSKFRPRALFFSHEVRGAPEER